MAVHTFSRESVDRIIRAVELIEALPVNNTKRTSRSRAMAPRIDHGPTMYRGELDGALATSDPTATIDNLVLIGGEHATAKASVTAENVFSISGADNSASLIVWCESLQRWELISVACVPTIDPETQSTEFDTAFSIEEFY